MTIITAEKRCAQVSSPVPHRFKLRLLPLAAAMVLATPVSHAQWNVTPSFALKETWSDNIELVNDDLSTSQFITELSPSLSVTGRSRRLSVNAFAAWDQYAYTKRNEMNSPADSQRRYRATLQSTIVDQLMYVDASANRSRRNVIAFGPGGETNPYSRNNQTDVESWSVSPYLVQRFGRDATMQLRYTRDSVDGGLSNAFGSSQGDTILLNLANGAELRSLGWGLNYMRQALDNKLVGKSSSETVNASLRYQFSRAWAATATAGYDRYDFEGPGPDNAGRNWSFGGAWTPNQRTSVQASFGRHLYGPTASLSTTLRSRRTTWDIQYSDVITSARSQFLLPAAIDTASMLDRMFNTTILDALERERAVAAYMQANGLPASLANNINYLSNRYSRYKNLRASFGYRLKNGTALLSAYRSENVALSDQQSDSPILGTSLSSLNDNVRQHGATASVNLRLNSLTTFNTGIDYRVSESLTTGIDSDERKLYVRVNRSLGQHVSASLEARRRTGSAEFAGRRNYTENALVAQLTMTY